MLIAGSVETSAHAEGSAGDISVDLRMAWGTADAIDQYVILVNQDSRFEAAANYVADALDDHLTELGRLGFIERCLRGDNVVEWAICQPDIDAFDPAKALAEIKADTKHPDWHRSAMRAELDAVKPKLKEHAEAVKEAMNKDAAYKKMFELAASTRKSSATRQSKDLRELALAMDDARTTGSRKALAGCEDKTWAAWKTAVSAIPAKRFSLAYKDTQSEVLDAAAATIVGEADGYLAAVALSACFGEKPDMLINYVERALVFWPGYRGPRNATHLAILQANLKLDQRGAELSYPRIDRRELFTGNGNGGNFSSSSGGQSPIVSVKANGELTHITFGPTKAKATKCTDYHPGTRLSRIESDGRLVYESSCGKWVEYTYTNDPRAPIDTPSRYAAALKPGMIVTLVEESILIGAPSLTATSPSVVFSVPVK